MKRKHLILALSIFFSSACFSSSSDEIREKERKLAERLESISGSGEKIEYDTEFSDIDSLEGLSSEIEEFASIDYSKIKISKDSIDIALYELIAYSDQMSDASLIKNIEILISKGAKPNAVVSISGSSRKAGTYIPIIKHFYKNKYRSYTYTSTAFHAAVAKGNTKIVQSLIDLGAKTGVPTKKGDYPIDIAVTNNDLKMIDFLLANGSNVKLINLSDSKNIALIEKLVKLGASPNTIDINFALEDKSKLKRLLVLKPRMQNLELDFKILFKDAELLNLLLDNGLPLSTRGAFPDRYPLIFGAVKYDNMKALEKLINLGADVSTRNKAGFIETPLLLAIHESNTDMVDYLLKKGASPNEKEWTKKSALTNAAEIDNDRIINLLIDAGAQIEYDKYFNKTPIMYAVSRKKYIAVQTLITRGANVNYRSKYSGTPLVMAIKENDYPIIKLLVDNGAKTNIKYEGKTLAEFAKAENAAPMIVDYLETAK